MSPTRFMISASKYLRRSSLNSYATCGVSRLARVNDQFFLDQKLKRAVAFHIDRVSEIAVIRWEHGNNDTAFMIVGRFIDSIANRKF
jgi:hypothetical protein